MYHSLLVPLDRSPFAEQALPLAVGIARRAHARLDLVEVHAVYSLEDRHAGWAPIDRERDAQRQLEEQLYLEATASLLTAVLPIMVSTGVLPGSVVLSEMVADSILERVRANQADLIVMATHGHSLLRRFSDGSVADELIRRAGVPVLLVRPVSTAPPNFAEPRLDNILIPLDGSTLAEQVIGPALDLAQLMKARLTLLRVIGPRSVRHNGAAGGSPKEAAAYLERVAARVREQCVSVQARVVVARHVADTISEEAAADGSRLIAVATHGRGRLARLLWGSVAHRLIRVSASPILVYHPSGNVAGQRRAETERWSGQPSTRSGT
jgi:nucleotide-binding universal stress UspA family protein